MRIFLNAGVDRLAVEILVGIAKLSGNYILFLTELQMIV